MMNNEVIYVTGHQRPDSDSIVSAIAYAKLKQRQGINAIACRLGEMQAETKYLLERFHFDEPLLLKDARATLQEIEMDPPHCVSVDTTIYDTLKAMEQYKMKSLGVVDHKNRLKGMITKSDIAKIGLGDTVFSHNLLKQTSIKNIAKAVSGKIIVESDMNHFNGHASIISYNHDGVENYELKDKLVILGSDKSAQKEAIKKGAAIMVLVWTKEVDKKVIELAKEYKCSIIVSGEGTMNTARYIYFSPAVELLMEKDLVFFNDDDLVEEALKTMSKTRYRLYPVVDYRNHLIGLVSRYHLMNYRKKKVILVDHNEYSQSVKGIESADLLEVIDHHRIYDIATTRPISFRNEIIGSSASIITSIYLENQLSIDANLAGLLLGAILSDTLKFRSPTTTAKDIGLAKMLAEIAQLDIDEFAKEMFSVSSDISNKTMKELITQDIKKFEIEDQQVMIGQVIISSFVQVEHIEADLQKELDQFVENRNLDLVVLAFTSIIDNGSIFYASGALHNLVYEAFPNKLNEKHSFHEGIVSRKTQIVPMVTKALT